MPAAPSPIARRHDAAHRSVSHAAPRLTRWRLLAGLFLVAAGCKGGTEGGPSGPTPAISVSLAQSSLTVTQGTSVDVQVTVSGSGGFSGSPTVSVEGAPSGVTGSVSAVATTGTTTTATLSVSATTAAPPGTYSLTVRATGAGVSAASAALSLVVAPAPALTLTLAQAAVSAVRGRTATVGLQLVRTNLTAPVTISVEGLTAGITAAVAPAPVNGTTATLTFTVDSAVVTGSIPLVVRATAAGVAAVTQALRLDVVDPAAIRLSLAQAGQSVDQGATGSNTVTITRTNYTGAVTLAMEGAPAGVVATFTPASVPGTSSTLSIAVAPTVPAGTYPLTLRATGDSLSATASLALTVATPAGYTLDAGAATVAVGASGTVPVSITRTNFTGAVTLALEGAPAGITGTFAPASPTGATSTLTIQVAGSVAPGPYALTIRGTASGQPSRTAPLSLSVVPVTGSYGLGINPVGSVTVAQGGAVAVPVRVQATGGFTGIPTVTATSATVGLTVVPGADTAQGPLVTALAITANSNLIPGTYSVSIRGTFPGLADVVTNYQVQVVPANLSLDFGTGCGTGTPIWLAVQDGDSAPWVRVLPVAGHYTTRFTAPRAALAFVTQGFGNNRSTIIQYGTSAELTAMAGDVLCGNPIQPSRTATASTTGLSGSETAQVTFGGGIRVFSSALPGGTISGITSGPHDLVARNAVQPGTYHPNDRVIIRRDLDPPNGGSLGSALSFTSSEALAPALATIGVSGLLPNEVVHSVGTVYFTRSCERSALWGVGPGAAITQFQARGVTVAQQRPSDYHGIIYAAGLTGGAFRQVTEYTHLMTSHTLPLGNPLPAPTVTTLPGSTFRLRVQLTLPSDLNGPFDLSYSVNTGRPVFVTASAAWRGGATVDLSVPDFSDLSGWTTSWGPIGQPGVTAWNATGSGASGVRCTEGAREVVASRTGVLP